MTAPDLRRASLQEIDAMAARGELHHDPAAPEGAPKEDQLPENFWVDATVRPPEPTGDM